MGRKSQNSNKILKSGKMMTNGMKKAEVFFVDNDT
ncbi:unnamed protein product, partial [Vitis vinifera]|uniref:Uncharacterized protein n=1 Tax=Vitis vinifera TaxID=29760 RepID=D7TLP1_VITVI